MLCCSLKPRLDADGEVHTVPGAAQGFLDVQECPALVRPRERDGFDLYVFGCTKSAFHDGVMWSST